MQGPIREQQEPSQALVSLQDLIGLGAGGTGTPAIVWCSGCCPWPGIHTERITGNQSRSYQSFNCSTAQGCAFLPTVLGSSFSTQFSPKIAVNATIAGPFMVTVATSSPCRGCNHSVHKTPAWNLWHSCCSFAQTPQGSFRCRGVCRLCTPAPRAGTFPSLQLQKLGVASSFSMEKLLGFG